MMSASTLVCTILIVITLTALRGTESRVLYTYHKQSNKSNNTTLYNDVTKWSAAGRTTQPSRPDSRWMSDQAVQGDQQVTEQLSEGELLRDMHKQIMLLRNNMANLKYQNHMIYKQMKRYNNRCMQGTAPMPESAALKTCPRDFVWNEKSRKCYKFANDRITWRMAREKCRNLGAELVSVESQKEQRFIVDTARNSKDMRHCDFWTGATDLNSDSSWRWVGTKNPLSYSNWNHNEPNNGNGDEHCMHMLWVFGWMWNDARCNYESSCYICEIRHH